MIRWASIWIKECELHICFYDSYTEAVLDAKAIYTGMVEEPDSFLVELVNTKDNKSFDEALYVGYNVIKNKEYMNFKSLLTASGMNLTNFSKAYGIPYRTVQRWASGEEPQIYMLSLLATAIFSNKEVDE